ncbi:MAG TPA: hypothetical protein VFJ85_06630 [Acidimicrobiales bacterium]|nr:hypothetical protein [Acidimicrobiales bacterium]
MALAVAVGLVAAAGVWRVTGPRVELQAMGGLDAPVPVGETLNIGLDVAVRHATMARVSGVSLSHQPKEVRATFRVLPRVLFGGSGLLLG